MSGETPLGSASCAVVCQRLSLLPILKATQQLMCVWASLIE